MRTTLFAFALGLLALCAPTRAANYKISDLPITTAPSTNTFIEVADMNEAAAADRSRKYLLTNLAKATQASIWTNAASRVRLVTTNANSTLELQANDGASGGTTEFWTGGTKRWSLNNGGTFFPEANYDIGTSLNPVQTLWMEGPTGVVLGDRILSSSTGDPEGARTGPVGSLFLRSDGASGTTLYTKVTGTGNTGWQAVPASGSSAPVGTMVNTGTPAVGALPSASDTTGTNLAPSFLTATNAASSNSKRLYWPAASGETARWALRSIDSVFTNNGTYTDQVFVIGYNPGAEISTNVDFALVFEPKYFQGSNQPPQTEFYLRNTPPGGSENRPFGVTTTYTNSTLLAVVGTMLGKWGMYDMTGATQQWIKIESGQLQGVGGDRSIYIDKDGSAGTVLDIRNNFGASGISMQGGYLNIYDNNGTGISMLNTNATSGATTRSAPPISMTSKYWNGSASVSIVGTLQQVQANVAADDAYLRYDRVIRSSLTYASAAISPTQITADQNNYNPGTKEQFIRLSTDASRTITGLTYTQTKLTGEIHYIANIGTNDIVLAHQSGLSTAANRFNCTTGSAITLSADQQAMLWYDGVSAFWRVSKMN